MYYIAIPFGGIVIFYARGVSSRVSLSDHCNPSPDSFLDERMLINTNENLQFQAHYYKSSLPGQNRGSEIMSRIKTIMLESHVSKILEARLLTDGSCDNLWGLSCQSGWTPFGHGCNLSQRCLLLLMSYRRPLWVVAVVHGIVQRSPYIHNG